MAIWLFRAGSNGEYEKKFLDEGRAYVTWDSLNIDLKTMNSKEELIQQLMNLYNDNSVNRMRNYASQIWPAVYTIEKGDWVVLPSKLSSTIHIGEVTSNYHYDKNAENPYFHWRDINWFATDIPRQNFDQDLLYSFGAFMTICRIQRNDAENRIKHMAQNNWKATVRIQSNFEDSTPDDTDTLTQYDLEETANDAIAKYIIRKYTGHGMAKLVEAILKAKGYTTYSSPAGPDEGVDILAAKGELGFETPKLCVQVKSGDTPVDRPTLDQLIGTMQNFGAEYGLLVSWSGFKKSVLQVKPNQFFKVRLWDQNNILNELFKNYESIDEEIRADIPLKRIWTLTSQED